MVSKFIFVLLLLAPTTIKTDEEADSFSDKVSSSEETLRECECWRWPQCVSNCSTRKVDEDLADSLNNRQVAPGGKDPLLKTLLEVEHRHLSFLPTPFVIVFPYQSRKNLATYDTSTLSKRGTYFMSTKFWLHLLSRKHVQLKLEKSNIFGKSNEFSSLYFRKRGNLITEIESDVSQIKHCQYTGVIKEDRRAVSKNSYVAVDTCDGIRGILYYEQKTYGIVPINCPHCSDRLPHVIFPKEEEAIERDVRLNTFWRPSDFRPTVGGFNLGSQITADSFVLRLGVILDEALYKSLNSNVEKAVTYATRVLNMATKAFQGSQVHLHMVHVEVWNLGNLASISSNIKTTLNSLVSHRLPLWRSARSLVAPANRHSPRSSGTANKNTPLSVNVNSVRGNNKATEPSARPIVDSTILLTKQLFTEAVEYITPPDSICSPRSLGVVQVTKTEDDYHVSRLVSLAIAEQLGIKSFPCPDLYRCDSNKVLSDGDLSRLKLALLSGIANCLLLRESGVNVPTPDTCGDGKVDRGEECDPGGAILGQAAADAIGSCCQANTCLAASWAECVGGGCCRNCSLISSGQICRPAKDECDLPEFCTGDRGSCPTDLHLENGQACREGGALCYQGRCPALTAQCQTVWGRRAHSAGRECYLNYNLRAKNSCGKNKCRRADVMCGVLHCEEGAKKPVGGVSENQFFVNYIYRKERRIQCKSLADSPDRYVREGTRCAPNHFCFDHRCVSPEQAIRSRCPHGPSRLLNQTCSARGVCTSLGRCLCSPEWTGYACQLANNQTDSTSNYIWMYMRALRQDRANKDAIGVLPPKVGPTPMTTGSLMMILGSVIGGAFVIFTFFIVCYRRRSGSPKKKYHRDGSLELNSILTNSRRSSEAGGLGGGGSQYQNRYLTASNPVSEVDDDNMDKIITFGPTPSYKDDKLMDMMGGSCSATPEANHIGQGQRRSSIDDESDSSGGSRSDHSTNKQINRIMERSWRQPEKSILKKPTSLEAAQAMSDDLHDCCSSHSSSLSSQASSSLLSLRNTPAQAPVVLCNAGNQTDTINSRRVLPLPLPQINTDDVLADDDCFECRAASSSDWINGPVTWTNDSGPYHTTDVMAATSHYHSTHLAFCADRDTGEIVESLYDTTSPQVEPNPLLAAISAYPDANGRPSNGHFLHNNKQHFDNRRNAGTSVNPSQFHPHLGDIGQSRINTTEVGWSRPRISESPADNRRNTALQQATPPTQPLKRLRNSPPPLDRVDHNLAYLNNASRHTNPNMIGTGALSSTAAALLSLPTFGESYPDPEDDLISEVSISAYRRTDVDYPEDDELLAVSELGGASEVQSMDGTCDESDTSSLPDTCADLLHMANLGHSCRPNSLLNDLNTHQQHPFRRPINQSHVSTRLSPELPPPPGMLSPGGAGRERSRQPYVNNSGQLQQQAKLGLSPATLLELANREESALRRQSYARATNSYESLDTAGH